MGATQANSVLFSEHYERESFFLTNIWNEAVLAGAKSLSEKAILLEERLFFPGVRPVFTCIPISHYSFVSCPKAPLSTLWPERLDVGDWTAFLRLLSQCPAQEMLVPAIAPESVETVRLLAPEFDLLVDEFNKLPAFKKHLIRTVSTDEFINSFGSSTRALIRRGERSKLQTVIPTKVHEAVEMLEALMEMHQTHWKEKGTPGAFAHDIIKDTHRTLVRKTFDRGESFFLGLQDNNSLCAIVYCFLHNGIAYQYQSARSETKLAPSLGITLHFRAMEELRRRGYVAYDFMAGENRLKRSLSDEHSELIWLRIFKKTPLLRLEFQLKKIKRKLWRR